MKLTLRGAVCALLLTLSLCFSACTKQASKPASASFEAMDTVMSLTVYGGDSDLCDRLKSRIEALDSALDSAAACYFRPLWDRYRIFGFWCDGEAGLEETLEPYLRDYMAETPYYRLADSRVEATQILSLTDREGEFYEQEAVEYMKLGVFEGMPEAVDAAEAGNLLHQAGSLGKVLGSYRTNGRDVLRLEKAAENIRENMEKQAEAMRKADDALREGDGGDFSRYTGELQDRCRKMPALVKKYEAEADRLAKQLNRSREEAAPEQENMSGGQWALAEQEMADFQSYVDRNGERRKQIVQAGTDTEDNIRISERAEERAEEVQEIIDSWDDDEDDEHDEEDEIQLWRTVLNITDGYHREDKVSTVRGEQNKKTMHLLEDLGNMGTEAIFTLCIPDGMTVSGQATAQEDFPSVTAGVSGGLQFPGQGKNPVAAILDPVLFAEYGIRYFPSAVDTASSAAEIVRALDGLTSPRFLFRNSKAMAIPPQVESRTGPRSPSPTGIRRSSSCSL